MKVDHDIMFNIKNTWAVFFYFCKRNPVWIFKVKVDLNLLKKWCSNCLHV